MSRRCATAALIAVLAPGGAFGHQGHVGNVAWTACETATLADACEYTDHEHSLYRGYCRLVSDALLCVRNRPIERSGPIPDTSGS